MPYSLSAIISLPSSKIAMNSWQSLNIGFLNSISIAAPSKNWPPPLWNIITADSIYSVSRNHLGGPLSMTLQLYYSKFITIAGRKELIKTRNLPINYACIILSQYLNLRIFRAMPCNISITSPLLIMITDFSEYQAFYPKLA